MDLETSPCKHCGVPVAWCRTTNGNAMPIDPAPNPRGNVFVSYENGKLIGRVRSKQDRRPRGVAFTPHFATCEELNRGRPLKEKQPCKPPVEPPPTLFDSA